jgi:hypothetical protein
MKIRGKRITAALMAATVVAGLMTQPRAWAVEVKHAGKLTIPHSTPLAVFSPDPTVMTVLSQDIDVARRGAGANAQAPVTITVNVVSSPLKPGVTLNQVALGDPDVGGLIQAAGATPPPLGDTGDQVDEAALAQSRAQAGMGLPHDTPMDSMLNAIQTHGEFGSAPVEANGGCGGMPCPDPNAAGQAQPAHPGDPGYTGDTQSYLAQGGMQPHFFHQDNNGQYQTVVVARAGLSGSSQEMTVVAVVNPGEDVHEAKRLVAEEIANSILR